MRKRLDLAGQKFGMLTAIKSANYKKDHQFVWECKCDCGNICYMKATELNRGIVASCGCSKKEVLLRKCVENTNLNLIKNQKPNRNNKTGIKGVFWSKIRHKYYATICFQRVIHRLGYHDTIEEAAKARKRAEEVYFKPILEKYEMSK
jgi:hypothetical protein